MAEEDSPTAVPAGALLPDRIALGVPTRLITRELVEGVIARTGRKEERKRLLPARVVVYFVLALALFYGDSYEEVIRKLVQGLSWLAIWREPVLRDGLALLLLAVLIPDCPPPAPLSGAGTR